MGSIILLADKSITIQKIVELTFADQDFTVRCVSDGQAALDAVPQVRPDLVLADISLPIRSGYDLCQAIRTQPEFAAFSKIPVILLAGIYETMDEERARNVEERAKESGATEVLSKPFDPQILTTKVEGLLSRKNGEGPPQEPMFADPLEISETQPATVGYNEAPSADSERTMMLPKSVLMDSMFADAPALAEASPQQEKETQPSRAPVNIEAISPAYEPVFDGDQEIAGSDASPLSLSDEQAEAFEEEPSILVPTTEDPFADVFEEPQSSWSASSTTEEESPFGVPEPPRAPESVVNTQPVEIPTLSEIHAAEEAEPMIDEPESVSSGEPITIEPPTVETIAEESYEDTWPGVIVPGHQPVEELFEPETSPLQLGVEEDTELETDLVDDSDAEEAPLLAAPAQNVEITDDLVERIAERVVQKLSERVVSEIVWQVVPDLAEKMIRRELEKLHAGEE